jgi:hypothetical protein
MGRQRRLNSLLNREVRQRIFCVDPMPVAYGDANLPDPSQPLFDQAKVATMERLVTADEQRRRLLRIEGRPQPRQRLLCPILRRALRTDAGPVGTAFLMRFPDARPHGRKSTLHR